MDVKITKEMIDEALASVVYNAIEKALNPGPACRSNREEREAAWDLENSLVRAIKRGLKEFLDDASKEVRKEIQDKVVERSVEKITNGVKAKDLLKEMLK